MPRPTRRPPVPPSAARQARLFAALGDPSRLRLVELLQGGDRAVHELAAWFQVSRPAISQHLRVLRSAGLVREDRAGRERRYRLEGREMRRAYEWIRRYERFWDERLRRLEATLERERAREEHSA
jgi:DNA-binding transcriptional ArsR family regulator